jgi:hypothetical protein
MINTYFNKGGLKSAAFFVANSTIRQFKIIFHQQII